jgi:large subunit ribosomal protein L4
MDAKIYNKSGKETGTMTLPEAVFAAKWNSDLVHQVVTAMQANARTPIAHAKDRSEVSGTTKKPWKQKGTGSARHGSKRSPIWRKGGVAHGPRNEKSYKQRINKKMRVKALYAVLSKKFKDGQVLFLDELTYEAPKTKEAKATILALSKIDGFAELATKRRNTALIAQVSPEVNTVKSLQNFSNITLDEVRNLNPATVLKYKYLVLAGGSEAVKQIENRAGDTVKETK